VPGLSNEDARDRADARARPRIGVLQLDYMGQS
jgi:hypothetical protein